MNKILMITIAISFLNINANVFFYKIKKNKENITINSTDEWVKTDSVFSELKYVGLPFEEEDYLPKISLQTLDFMQIQKYKQKMIKEEQKREINLKNNEYKNTELLETEVVKLMENKRLIKVEVENWITKKVYSCSSYYPYTSSFDKGEFFEQSKNCYIDIERKINYSSEGVLIETNIEKDTYIKSYSRMAQGTKSVSFNATFGCPSGWTPSGNSYGRCYTKVLKINADGTCPRGYTITNAGNCANYISMVYSCPRGYRLSGRKCYS